MTNPFAQQMPPVPMPAPQQVLPEVQGGFGIAQDNPAVGKLILVAGATRFEVMMATESAARFLRQLADQIDAQMAKTPPIVRPVAGLFLPNGAMPRNGG